MAYSLQPPDVRRSEPAAKGAGLWVRRSYQGLHFNPFKSGRKGLWLEIPDGVGPPAPLPSTFTVLPFIWTAALKDPRDVGENVTTTVVVGGTLKLVGLTRKADDPDPDTLTLTEVWPLPFCETVTFREELVPTVTEPKDILVGLTVAPARADITPIKMMPISPSINGMRRRAALIPCASKSAGLRLENRELASNIHPALLLRSRRQGVALRLIFCLADSQLYERNGRGCSECHGEGVGYAGGVDVRHIDLIVKSGKPRQWGW
jgi:hypothetical protein